MFSNAEQARVESDAVAIPARMFSNEQARRTRLAPRGAGVTIAGMARYSHNFAAVVSCRLPERCMAAVARGVQMSVEVP